MVEDHEILEHLEVWNILARRNQRVSKYIDVSVSAFIKIRN